MSSGLPIVWTVANQKGGVGKTTTSIALADQIVQAGKRVLLIDLDPHGSMTTYFDLRDAAGDANAYQVFHQRKSLSQALLDQQILPTQTPGLHLLAATTALATLERQGIGDGMGLVLKRSLQFLDSQFEHVIIDCPPQLGILMVNALAACERLIIPVQTEFLAIQGLERMLSTVKMLDTSMSTHLPLTIVPTMFDRRTQASVSSLRQLQLEHADQLWPSKIPIDTRLRDASKAGRLPSEYAGHSRGVEAYQKLYHSLLQ